MSFVYLAIYWNNHHHMLHAVKRINGAVLWANMHLLFWLSLVPFVTAWMGASRFAAIPVAAYGCVLLAAAIAYFVLSRVLIATHPENAVLAIAVGRDCEGDRLGRALPGRGGGRAGRAARLVRNLHPGRDHLAGAGPADRARPRDRVRGLTGQA